MTPKWGAISSRSPKCTNCRNTSFEPTRKPYRKPVFFTHSQSGNGCVDFNQILHIDFLGEHSDILETASKLVQGFGRSRGANFPLSHWLYRWLLTLRIALPRIRVIDSKPNCFITAWLARYMCPVSVFLSVRLSDASRCSIEKAK